MSKRLTCFIPAAELTQVEGTIAALKHNEAIENIYLLATTDEDFSKLKCPVLKVDSLSSSKTVELVASLANTDYTLLYSKFTKLELGYFALERMLFIADSTNAAMVYADNYQIKDGVKSISPLIDYQEGSLRDDFNFGSMLVYRSSILKKVAEEENEYPYAGMYNLRLNASRLGELVHINEYLYTEVEKDTRQSGQKMFDYVDPKNRAVQVDMEKACTEHLKKVGAFLKPQFKPIEFNSNNFPVEASVIIPVFNRIRTVKDAIKSVLIQKTKFDFNLIIVDNHSTDGTTEAIREFNDPRLIHIIPERRDLGIGGCWNAGVHHSLCGKFAVQLDSDDVYSSENTLQTMVDAFYEQNCAMVVGTYMMTNFDMEMIAPGIIDHKEWTPDNGRNNALRINGLGAPRAFYTPVLREIKVPNTSYGEDYALGLAFSRHYQIGRVYDVVYNCRRWEDNSDASLDVVKMNAHNLYKDRIRTWELKARKQINAASNE